MRDPSWPRRQPKRWLTSPTPENGTQASWSTSPARLPPGSAS